VVVLDLDRLPDTVLSPVQATLLGGLAGQETVDAYGFVDHLDWVSLPLDRAGIVRPSGDRIGATGRLDDRAIPRRIGLVEATFRQISTASVSHAWNV